MSRYFKDGYTAFRRQFLEAADAAGALIVHHPLEAKGPAGESLAVDEARLGAENPKRLLAIMSGTHGVEGPAGSAVQAQLLNEGLSRHRLPADGSLLLVHANNPFGFAWGRRQNEDNVDINRNFRDHTEPTEVGRDYAEVHDLLCPKDLDEKTEEDFLTRAWALVDERGMEEVQRIFTQGQYDFPEGLYFGGTDRVASIRILSRLMNNALKGVEEALIIDMHTGAGPWGVATLLANHDAGTPEHRWIEKHFPDFAVESPAAGGSIVPLNSGQIGRGLVAENPETAVRAFTCEIGTYEGARMIMAERRENWLHHHGDRKSALGQSIAKEVRECSNPDSDEWRDKVLDIGRRMTADAWNALFAD